MNILKHKNKILVSVLAVFIIMLIIFQSNAYPQNTLEECNNSQTQTTETEMITPHVEFTKRYLFTNNIANTSFDGIITKVSESPDWSAKLIRFQKHGNLEQLNEAALNELTDMIPLPCDAMELSKLGIEEPPTEEGIYQAVLKVSDNSVNFLLEEIYIIYDTTGARIDDIPDKTIYVDSEDLDKEPQINKSDYTIIDNVDGKIASENIQCELELRDADKHEWLAHVSYTDRAGNDSKAEFLIIVKEKKNETTNSQEISNADVNNTNTSSDPADINKDGIVDGEEASDYIHPTEQAVIDAGYGVVVQLDTNTYSVLTHGDATANGKHGFDILAEYLAEMDLYANNMSGCWIDSDKDLYRCIATNIVELVTPDDEGYWD